VIAPHDETRNNWLRGAGCREDGLPPRSVHLFAKSGALRELPWALYFSRFAFENACFRFRAASENARCTAEGNAGWTGGLQTRSHLFDALFLNWSGS